ncbi:coiled-coil domain-containing protein 89-like [Mytilus californianus]|uniref:coiled-coil domain-containing protein 89-like n=1 Tax=Mytilus californianus TaxID=6549 RepID=UPI002246CD29|nr:coiled-coil domain-containing protein 89-like [Mytilus californianus]
MDSSLAHQTHFLYENFSSILLGQDMASNTRNPKEIREMVSDSNKDMSDMQRNLSKLKSLSEDDKTETAMLRSRIDEQSQLIMILKQRADDVSRKSQTLDKINKEMMDFRENAQEMLDGEIRKYNILNARFDDLASNHQELIKIKDEYKRSNQELRIENSRLREENERIFSGAILEKDKQIAEMDRKLSSFKEQYNMLEQKHRQLQQDMKGKEDGLRNEIKTVQENYRTEVKMLQSKLQDSEERLKGANYKLQNQIEGRKSLDVESQHRIQQLTKEKDELLDLAMQRGKIVQREQTENKKLQRRIEDMEKAVQTMEEKFEREATAVNANLQVRRLREEASDAGHKYTEVVKEFEAYRKHSQTLLQREKDLNERLRHLAG